MFVAVVVVAAAEELPLPVKPQLFFLKFQSLPPASSPSPLCLAP